MFQSRVVNEYEKLASLISKVYTEEEALIIACPSMEQVSVFVFLCLCVIMLYCNRVSLKLCYCGCYGNGILFTCLLL